MRLLIIYILRCEMTGECTACQAPGYYSLTDIKFSADDFEYMVRSQIGQLDFDISS